MQKKDLMIYLAEVLKLEMDWYTTRESMDDLAKQKRTVAGKETVSKPGRRTVKYQYSTAGGVAGGIVAPVIRVVMVYNSYPSIKYPLLNSILTAPFAILFGVLLGGWLIFPLVKYIVQTRQENQRYADAMQKYDAACRQTERNYQQRKTDTEQYNAQIDAEIRKLEHTLGETASALSRIYDLNVIHPKYRYVGAVAAFYSYLDTGRCKALEGATGAYNKYDQEQIGSAIVGELRGIRGDLQNIGRQVVALSAQLSSIREGQAGMRQALEQSRQTAVRMGEEVARIARSNAAIRDSAEISAYCAERSARASEATKKMAEYEHRLLRTQN